MGTFSRPCLVDIDIQVDFVLPEGALYVPGAEQLIPLWRELTAFGASHGLPMIASVCRHTADDPEFQQFPPHCVEGTPGQQKIPETLMERHQFISNRGRDTTIDFESQLILEKSDLDCFSNVHAEDIFSLIRCTTFVVYGLTTEYCVRVAVLGLLARGHRVHVVQDAIKPLEETAGERALAEMANAGAAFIQSGTFFERVRQHMANRVV